MAKLIAFFLVMMVGCGLLVGIMQGGGGVVTTELTNNITATETTINVTSTTDFLSTGDYIYIGSEKITYTAMTSTSFTGCVRGVDAKAHVIGAYVYTQKAAALNYALGFDIVAVQDNYGWVSWLAIPFLFMVRTIPNVIRMGAPIFTGDLAVIGIFIYALITGFVIVLILAIVGRRSS
jgi:hypothetical protein